jgi:hypothetical protein
MKQKRRLALLGITVGLLLGSGAVYAAAVDIVAVEKNDLNHMTANAQEPRFTANGPVRRFSGVMTNNLVCRTTATTLETIPGTTVKFTQDREAPVEVTFVATWPTPRPDQIPPGSRAAGAFIFLFIDGDRVDPISEFGGVLVHDGSAPLSNGTHGFTFVTRPLRPGRHVAQMKFLDNVLGPFGEPNGTMCVFQRSTVVEHS